MARNAGAGSQIGESLDGRELTERSAPVTDDKKGWIVFIRFLLARESMQTTRSIFLNAFSDTERNELALKEGRAKPKSIVDIVRMWSVDIAKNGAVCIAGDQIYLYSNDFMSLSKALGNMRDNFLREGYFFKAVVHYGHLAFENVENTTAGLSGFSLSGDVRQLHQTEEEFKGAGFRLSRECLRRIRNDDDRALQNAIVKSVYLPVDDKSAFVPYYDIAFTKGEVGIPERLLSKEDRFSLEFFQSYKDVGFAGLNIEDLENAGVSESAEYLDKSAQLAAAKTYILNFRHTMAAAGKLKGKYVRFYIPALVAMIRSSDFSQIFFDKNGDWQCAPPIFNLIIADHWLKRQLKRSSLVKPIYYCFVDTIIQSMALRAHKDQARLKYDCIVSLEGFEPDQFDDEPAYQLECRQLLEEQTRSQLVSLLVAANLFENINDVSDYLVDEHTKDRLLEIYRSTEA